MELSGKTVRMLYTKHSFIHIKQCYTVYKGIQKMAYIKYIRMVARSGEWGMEMGLRQTNDELNSLTLKTEPVKIAEKRRPN